ncbi:MULTISPECIES: hypothetical protein [Aeromonas]|jgi:hypothetical protein|uniref:DUF2163 domain-containing protein n=1 Tax=Aeromonas veronii TaxID=654 RepID=A0AAX2UP25_AERVE|nr:MULTISPECIES: hypothetical protein [Aeromonas]MCD6618753.1 hypothetical protein [Aeromonas veronii]QWZ66372.1 hypothetical protein I6L47_22240 [Aeromonas sp. FDAARGOS 1417]TND51884.1 hypothetical protein CF123_18620 [Aeromonas veronii]BEE07080.1 hypothetical protein VAWG002_42760 [Aeromonas veronii]
MNNLSIASVLEKNRISSENAMTMALDIELIDPVSGNYVMTLRIANYDTDLTIDGNLYTKIGFDLSLQDDTNELQNVTLTIQDQVGLIRPYLQTYRGAVGSRVTMMIVTVDPTDKTTLIDFSEMFEIVSSSSPDYAVSIELGAENPLMRMFPGRTQMRDRCSFRYKSACCGYSGDLPSCDLTLTGDNGCRAHQNESRFGGAPSITVAVLS